MNVWASPPSEPTVAAAPTPFLRLCVNAVRGRLFGGRTSGEGWERHNPINWNARLTASLRPDPQYLQRRRAAKAGWITRKGGAV